MTSPIKRPVHRPVDTSELFFDLVFVAAITQVTAIIHDQEGITGLVQAGIAFALVYWLWTVGSILMSFRDMSATFHRLILFGAAFCALLITIALPRAFDD